MVIAYHLIWTAYGWWLPNDPRGSSSHFIHSDIIFELGNLHHGRKRVQPSSREIREFYDIAAGKLKHKLFTANAREFPIIADAFHRVIREKTYTCYAAAIMPDHVHLLIRKHKFQAEDMIEHFQSASREALIQAGYRPADHPVCGGPGWKVFLDSPEDVHRTVNYIETNPQKSKLPRQNWPFIVPYNNWPLHKTSHP